MIHASIIHTRRNLQVHSIRVAGFSLYTIHVGLIVFYTPFIEWTKHKQYSISITTFNTALIGGPIHL